MVFPPYESTCQSVKTAVKEWFELNPEKIQEAIELNSLMKFCTKNKELYEIISKYEPSAAQAGAAFWAAIQEVEE